jgi:hypothetical protein
MSTAAGQALGWFRCGSRIYVVERDKWRKILVRPYEDIAINNLWMKRRITGDTIICSNWSLPTV